MVAEAREMENQGQPEYLPGTNVERLIEGMWFPAVIIEVDKRRQEYMLRYLDDDQLESNVPIDEIRHGSIDSSLTPRRKEKKDTLRKPLLGLVEDDSEIRSNHQPVVTVHNDSSIGKKLTR
jgi:hypothetical protein